MRRRQGRRCGQARIFEKGCLSASRVYFTASHGEILRKKGFCVGFLLQTTEALRIIRGVGGKKGKNSCFPCSGIV